jgi:hypothetical protein
MVIAASGRVAVRRREKDPVRYQVGLRCAESPNHVSKHHGRIRSGHLGYDCYATGQVNTSGKIRCILRPGRLPPHLPQDARVILPNEMWWPIRDHDQAHQMVDAVIGFDLSTLSAWRAQWPTHEFGYEHFCELAQRRVAAVREDAIPDVPALPPRLDATAPRGQPVTSASQGGPALPRQLGLFPGEVVGVEPQGGLDHGTHIVRTAIVRFDDGLAALRVDVGVQMEDGGKLLCSRAYVDLVDGRYEIVQHYPGRLRALHLPSDLIYQTLGIRTARSPPRTELGPRPPGRPHPGRTSPELQEARIVQAVTSSGDPDARAVEAPQERPEPVPGTARHAAWQAARVEEDQEGTRYERFPDAPSGRPAAAPAAPSTPAPFGPPQPPSATPARLPYRPRKPLTPEERALGIVRRGVGRPPKVPRPPA